MTRIQTSSISEDRHFLSHPEVLCCDNCGCEIDFSYDSLGSFIGENGSLIEDDGNVFNVLCCDCRNN